MCARCRGTPSRGRGTFPTGRFGAASSWLLKSAQGRKSPFAASGSSRWLGVVAGRRVGDSPLSPATGERQVPSTHNGQPLEELANVRCGRPPDLRLGNPTDRSLYRVFAPTGQRQQMAVKNWPRTADSPPVSYACVARRLRASARRSAHKVPFHTDRTAQVQRRPNSRTSHRFRAPPARPFAARELVNPPARRRCFETFHSYKKNK